MSKQFLTSYYYIYKQFKSDNSFDHMVGGKVNIKWEKFHHNGVMFPPKYEPHGIPIMYKGKKIQLTNEQEEYATIFSRYIDTEYYKGDKFKKNFWKDWQKILGKEHIIKDLEGCDFSLIYKYILDLREKKKSLSKEEKEKIKEIKEKNTEKYNIC